VSLARLATLTRAGSGMFWITVRGDQVVRIGEQWSPWGAGSRSGMTSSGRRGECIAEVACPTVSEDLAVSSSLVTVRQRTARCDNLPTVKPPQ